MLSKIFKAFIFLLILSSIARSQANVGGLQKYIYFWSSKYISDSLCNIDSINYSYSDSSTIDSHIVYFVRIVGDTSTVYWKTIVQHNHEDTVRVRVPTESLIVGEPLQYIVLSIFKGRNSMCMQNWVIIPRPFSFTFKKPSK